MRRKVSEQSIQQYTANTRAALSRRDTDAQLRQRRAGGIRAQRWTAVIRPHRTHGDTLVVLGDDRHNFGRREHFEHLLVVRVRQGPILNDAGVTRHFDNESVIAGMGCTQIHNRFRHAPIVAAMRQEDDESFCARVVIGQLL
jgi:hypothetical protein